MMIRKFMTALALTAGLFAVSAPAHADAVQLGPKTSYTAQQIADAVHKSPLSESLKGYASEIGKLAVEETHGNAGISNGACCSGVLAMSRTNLAHQGLTAKQYANMSLQEQIDVWARYANNVATTPAIKKIMTKRGSDKAYVVKCIQFGAGNCRANLINSADRT